MILFFSFKHTTMLVHCGRTRSGMHETEGSRERRLAVDAYASHPALFYLRAVSPIRKSRGPMQGGGRHSWEACCYRIVLRGTAAGSLDQTWSFPAVG